MLSEAPLPRLRVAFTALGIALVLAVSLLLQSALAKLDEQRELRQAMVGERVFDEVERELSGVLQLEARRPSAAYDGGNTDPHNWAPFVLGYYRREPAVAIVAEARLDAARATRVRAAVDAAQTELDRKASEPVPADESDDADEPSAQPKSPDVLRQLNRGAKVRARRQHRITHGFFVVATDANTLVVERRSEDGARREGFVLDAGALVATIQSWVLGAQGLDKVATLSTSAPRATGPRGAHDFEHRLAPPLESQRIFLRLSPLQDEDARGTLQRMALLLCGAALAGLVALYRMAAVQVRFAERRNNFVSAVTHELKTPLTAIRMYGEMLRDDMVQDDATRREYYAMITAESERLSRLINNVMEHARLRRGERPLQLVATDLGAIAREVAELLEPHLDQQGFGIEVEVEPDLPPVRVDVDALRQVLFNLIDNAAKYGRGETCRVLVRCSRSEDAVVIAVRDFGRGVADNQLELIFEPFYRGQSELTRTQQGTGIGLSLVRDLVARMNGRVRGRNEKPGLEIAIAFSRS